MTTPQEPLNSPFRASNTVDDVLRDVNLSDKTVIVTGGYAGLGREAVRALLAANAQVIVPARNMEKARKNLADLPKAIILPMDLMDPASIDAFAAKVAAEYPKVDILINNAGTMASPLARDAAGNESQFSTNVLGHFRLTARLWPALAAAHSSRVVMLSSANHRADVAELLRDPNFTDRSYDPWVAYAQSKAANILLAVAMDRIGKSEGIRAFAVHPGGIFETDLVRHMDISIAKAAGMIDDDGNPIIDPEAGWKTPEQGASTMVWAATSELLDGEGGVYCADNNIAPQDATDGGSLTNGVAPSATDAANAESLWRLCERLTGVRFPVASNVETEARENA